MENKYKDINECVIDNNISILSFHSYPIDMDSLSSPPSSIINTKTPEQLDILYSDYQQIIDNNEQQYNHDILSDDETYFECNQIDHHYSEDNTDIFYDACENPIKKVFHLAIDHQFLTREKGKGKAFHTTHDKVDAVLDNMAWSELVGEHESFSTLAYAISTVEKFQRLENIQPNLPGNQLR